MHEPVRRTALRVVMLFTAFSLAMMPQMLNAQRATAMPDDVGTLPVPVNEEEVKHNCTFPLPEAIAQDGTASLQPMRAVHADDVPLCGAHGEVPHPPPWD